MSFKNAIESVAEPVKSAYKAGKQALPKKHAKQVVCTDEKRITGSIFLDDALVSVKKHSQASRWDYGIGYTSPSGSEYAIWVEVHTASTDEVSTVMNKKKWLKDFLTEEAPQLWKLSQRSKAGIPVFVWVASNGVHINRNSPQARMLATSGVTWPTRVLKLD